MGRKGQAMTVEAESHRKWKVMLNTQQERIADIYLLI